MPYSNKGLPIILTQGEMEKMFLKGLYNFEVVLQFVLFFTLSNQVIFSCCHSGAQKVEVIGSPIKSLFFPENFHWSQEALVTRNSRHYEGLQRFSRCEEIQELGL